MLQAKLTVVKTLDEQVLELCETAEISKEVDEADEIESRVLDMRNLIAENRTKFLLKAKNISTNGAVNHETSATASVESEVPQQTLQSLESQATSSSGMSSVVEQSSDSHGSNSLVEQSNLPVHQNATSLGGSNYSRSKLPKLVLPKFKGDITSYRTFWDSFESAVHQNPQLSKIDKFNYLNSLLEGRAIRAVQGLTVSEDNYQAAIDILQQRFGKPQQIISAHMDELMKIPPCTVDKPSQLRYVYDKISVHTRGLASLGVDSKQYGSLLIPVIMAKLPQEVRIQVARETTKEIWEITDILNVILKEVEAREVGENVKISADSTSQKPPTKHPINAATSLANQATRPLPRSCKCAYCNESHFSASCEKVVDMNTRKQILKRDHRCFICLGRGHRADQCDPSKSCRRCNGRHHQSICTVKSPSHSQKPPQHPLNQSQDQETRDPEGSSNQTPRPTQATPAINTTTTVSKERRSVLLQTATTTVQSSNGSRPVTARILFDSGSQRSYITNSLKAKLGLVPVKSETVNLNTFGDKRFSKQLCDLVQVSLQGKNGFDSISALCFPKICSPLSTTINIHQYPHLQDLELADCYITNEHNSNTDIDILIGSDYYFDLITGEIVRGEKGPVAINSAFGWLVSGPTKESESFAGVSTTNLIIESPLPPLDYACAIEDQDADSGLTRAVQRFWETEAIGIKEKLNPNESNFVRNIHFLDGEGRYEVGLPWKDGTLPNSTGYTMCLKRLRQLQSRLKKDRDLFQDYDQIIREQERTGIVEQTTCNETSGHFLPHQGVIRQDKETTKLRIVFDGSAKPSEDDRSINDCLEKGPNSVPLLFDIIIRFREYPIGLTADIEKAFHQIQIAPEDREKIKFLWFDDVTKRKSRNKALPVSALAFWIEA